VVGSFHGLSRERSDARKYPAINPLDSWSKYKSVIREDWVEYARSYYHQGSEVEQMMKVIGEDGISLADFTVYLKSDFLDTVYFQQNSFDEVDAAPDVERQTYVFEKLLHILGSDFNLEQKDEARSYFNQLRQKFLDWNYSKWKSDDFKHDEADLDSLYVAKSGKLTSKGKSLIEDGE
jgi:V/A-type H+-transporting ATPase subunit A